MQWKAHEGLILKVDWNLVNAMIVSCGEDKVNNIILFNFSGIKFGIFSGGNCFQVQFMSILSHVFHGVLQG
jgi:hypothetical protein